MTLLDENPNIAMRELSSDNGANKERHDSSGRINVGSGERAVSVAAGSILALFGLARRSVPGLVISGIGGALLYRGATGHCAMYQSLGIDTAQGGQEHDEQDPQRDISERGIHIEQAFLINRSPADLYQFWRNFENLPRIMTHLESVRVIDDRRSHWVARPIPVIGKLEWDAEIIQDDVDSRIAWRSLPGWNFETSGEIRFSKALGDRGTEVHVHIDYLAAGGQVGQWLAPLFSKASRRLIREDLRNFKRLMEIGEIPTLVGQPRGTCTGSGTRERA